MKKDVQITLSNQTKQYILIPNDVIADEDLTCEALGLYAIIMNTGEIPADAPLDALDLLIAKKYLLKGDKDETE